MCVCVCVCVCALFQVRDGSSEYSPMLTFPFCETSLPLVVTSFGNSMWIKFRSDDVSNNASTGFVANYVGHIKGRFQHNATVYSVHTYWIPLSLWTDT